MVGERSWCTHVVEFHAADKTWCKIAPRKGAGFQVPAAGVVAAVQHSRCMPAGRPHAKQQYRQYIDWHRQYTQQHIKSTQAVHAGRTYATPNPPSMRYCWWNEP